MVQENTKKQNITTQLHKEATVDTSPKPRENNNRKKVKLVVSKAGDFREVRCPNCGVLLYKELIKSSPVNRIIQIKCRSCGALLTS